MKILAQREQKTIASHLALIWYCISRFNLDLSDESERTYIEMATLSILDVANIAGGMEMVWRIPGLADRIRDMEGDKP